MRLRRGFVEVSTQTVLAVMAVFLASVLAVFVYDIMVQDRASLDVSTCRVVVDNNMLYGRVDLYKLRDVGVVVDSVAVMDGSGAWHQATSIYNAGLGASGPHGIPTGKMELWPLYFAVNGWNTTATPLLVNITYIAVGDEGSLLCRPTLG